MKEKLIIAAIAGCLTGLVMMIFRWITSINVPHLLACGIAGAVAILALDIFGRPKK